MIVLKMIGSANLGWITAGILALLWIIVTTRRASKKKSLIDAKERIVILRQTIQNRRARDKEKEDAAREIVEKFADRFSPDEVTELMSFFDTYLPRPKYWNDLLCDKVSDPYYVQSRR